MAIVIEGVDGTGKSTMCDMIAQEFGLNIYRHFSSAFGKEIYRIMEEYGFNCMRDRFLFYALATHEYAGILSGAYGGDIKKILLDRYTPISNLIYGMAFNSPEKTLAAGADTHIVKDIDLILIYTVDYDVAQERMDRRKNKSTYDKASRMMFERINNYYTSINEWMPEYIEDFPTCDIIDTTHLTIQEQFDITKEVIQKSKFCLN